MSTYINPYERRFFNAVDSNKTNTKNYSQCRAQEASECSIHGAQLLLQLSLPCHESWSK